MFEKKSRLVLFCDGRGLTTAEMLTTSLRRVFEVVPPGLREDIVVLGTKEIESQGFGRWADVIQEVSPDWVGYIPLGDGRSGMASLPEPPEKSHGKMLVPWIPSFEFPLETARAIASPVQTWLMTGDLCLEYLALGEEPPFPWPLMDLAATLTQQQIHFAWGAIANGKEPCPLPERKNAPKVLALVPFYRCETWLKACLQSLVAQTRPPDHIVVIDDGSEVLPLEIVRQFPTVTLLGATVNGGPYRLLQTVIEATDYDYYLFQDADDWSMTQRLETLLAIAQTTHADLIGSQEIRLEEASQRLFAVTYPLDGNQALVEKPGHPLLHPTSLVKRDLVMAVNGFATGLRFGGDTEFLLRAALVGRVINSPDYLYVRRRRSNSLTTDPATGLDSPARQRLLETLKTRAYDNYAALQRGEAPNLKPLCQWALVALTYHWGPQLWLQSPWYFNRQNLLVKRSPEQLC
ncbi:MAG: glycosyltransferase family A protein [Synechococcus sp.]|nr:glycosyltransferase family A protein [Synechococcus sp.]